jgi:RNA polymerase sigma-70 factor (ECF subfamily)
VVTEEQKELRDLYLTHAPRVRRLLARLVPPSEIDDTVQEVFLRIHRFRQDYRGDSAWSTWIYRITINCAQDVHRRQRWRRWMSFGLEGFDPADPTSTPPEPSVDLQKALESLSFAERTVVTLFYWEEASLEEISQLLEIPLGTVKSRLSQARKKLKLLITQEAL